MILILIVDFDFQSELEEFQSLLPNASEKNSSQDDILSQVLGKDRHGYVRTYGKGVVASDLWGTKSQVEIQKTIEEVKRNARIEIQFLQERLQKEMEVKLKEQLEAFKGELLGGLNIVLTQIHQCYPKIVIPTLFSIPKTNDVQADARSFVDIKEGKEENAHKKLREKGNSNKFP